MNEVPDAPSWEVLIGDMKVLDHLATLRTEEPQPHALQQDIEVIIATELTPFEQQLFFMRFGEQMPHRAIAKELGYQSHYTIQRHIDRIIKKVREALGRIDVCYDADADN